MNLPSLTGLHLRLVGVAHLVIISFATAGPSTHWSRDRVGQLCTPPSQRVIEDEIEAARWSLAPRNWMYHLDTKHAAYTAEDGEHSALNCLTLWASILPS